MTESPDDINPLDDILPEDIEESLSPLDAHASRILLIEDSASDAALLKKTIRELSGHDRFEFVNVVRLGDALNLLDEESFDLVLLDLHLLDIEGSAAVAALHAAIPSTPIVVHSGADDPQLKREALICGARYYLVKGQSRPLSFRLLIHEAIAASQAHGRRGSHA